MGHSVSADKRERQNLKRKNRNRENMAVLRREMKTATAKVGGGDAAALPAAFKALDRAARKNAIPKGRANRRKSRLALALKRAAAQKGTGKTATS